MHNQLSMAQSDIRAANVQITMIPTNQLSRTEADIRSVSSTQITFNGQIISQLSTTNTVVDRIDTSVNSIHTWISNSYQHHTLSSGSSFLSH